MYIKCLFSSLLILSCLSLLKSESSCPKKIKECVENVAFCHIYGTEGTGTLSQFSEYFRTCPRDEICKVPLASKVGQCVKNIKLISENEPCNVSSECMSGVCKNSKCVYVPDGQSCDFDSNCGRESFCGDNKTCVPLKKEGEDCNLDKECQVGLACGKTNGNKEKCTKMFSLNPGDQSNNELLCKDGYIHSIENVYYCAKASLENEKCEIIESDQCKMTINAGSHGIGLVAYGTCKCNWNGEAYCQPVSNSKVWTDFVETYSSNIAKVNKAVHYSTMRDDWWGIEKIMKAWVDYKEFFNLKDADSCVKNFYYRQAQVNALPSKGGYIKMAFMSIILSFVFLL